MLRTEINKMEHDGARILLHRLINSARTKPLASNVHGYSVDKTDPDDF